MTINPNDIERCVDANAALLELPLDPAHRAGVLQFFTLAAEMAEVVMAVPLEAHDESGAAFLPVEPRGDA